MEASNGNNRSIAFNILDENSNAVIILASFDFSYYHNLELVFYEVGYNNIPFEAYWWDHWTKDQLELSDENFPDGFEFRFNLGTQGDRQYRIHAKGFSYYLENFGYLTT